jgi:hypothetical protein
MRPRVYVASKSCAWPWWTALRAAGLPIISSRPPTAATPRCSRKEPLNSPENVAQMERDDLDGARAAQLTVPFRPPIETRDVPGGLENFLPELRIVVSLGDRPELHPNCPVLPPRYPSCSSPQASRNRACGQRKPPPCHADLAADLRRARVRDPTLALSGLARPSLGPKQALISAIVRQQFLD